MKKYFKLLLILLFAQGLLYSQTTTCISSGNWEDSSTWNNGVPTSTGDVYIDGFQVTVNSNVSCNSVTCKGASGGSSVLTINSGFKLTLSSDLIVLPTNEFNNDSYINGFGELDIQNLQVGFATTINTFPTITRLTTLYVDDVTNFKINGNLISTTPVNTSPVAFNESRLRHRSGTINLYGLFNVINGNSGVSALGYRSDNQNQGDANINFYNKNITLPTSALTQPNFTGSSVGFLFTTPPISFSLYNLNYKGLTIDSAGTYFGTGCTIMENGKLNLKNGIISSNIIINNNVTIKKTNGTIYDDGTFNYDIILTSETNKYTVIYEQNTTTTYSGRELQAEYNGIIEVGALEELIIDSTNPINISNNFSVNKLTINTNTSINGNGKINIVKLFNISNNTTLSTTDDVLVLKSTEANTARVSQLQNVTINGKIIVERYLKNNRRQWRLLTAPLKGNTNNSVLFNWQNNGIYTSSSIDVDIWGPTGTMSVSSIVGPPPFFISTVSVQSINNGLININNSSYNLRKYNNTSGLWSYVEDTTSENLFNSNINNAFLIFATHPFLKSTNLNGESLGSSISTTLNASGNLLTGDITYNSIFNNKYYLIGNPYASPINFASILAEPGNEGVKKIWVMDPTVGELGGYVTWDSAAGYSNGGSSFNGNTILQSGEAFFVLAHGTGSLIETYLTIKESHKSSLISNTTLNKTNTNQTNSSTDLFKIILEKEVSGTYENMDGCVAAFYQGGNNNLDSFDGYKLSNPSENIALLNGTTSLSIEHRANVQDNDFLTLRISNTNVNTNYKLKLYTQNFTFDGTAYLEDLFLGTSTPIALDGSIFEYIYQVTTNAASTGNRFKVVFQSTALNNETVTNNYFSIYPNPASNQDVISITFRNAEDSNVYDYKIYNSLGQLIQSDKLNKHNTMGSILLDKKLSTGLYYIQLNDLKNNQKYTQSLLIK
jgi:hypothetical protein